MLASTSALAQQPAPAGSPAGQTRTGEACVYVPVAPEPVMRARQTVDIRCGAAGDPVARVYQVDGTSDSAGLAAWTASGVWRGLLDSRAFCERSSAMTLAGQPAALLACARRSGGVPYVAVATARGGSTFLGEGLSTAAPAIEATIAALAGGAAAGGRTSTITTALGGRYAATYNAADADRYAALMRLGARHNIEEEYGPAERNYREALALQQRLFGRDNPDQADPMAHLAMNISNQGRFDEASTLFRRAEALAANTRDPLIRARVRQYVAQHLANQGRRAQARAALDDAEAQYYVAAPDLRTLVERATVRPPADAPVVAYGVRGQLFVDPRRDEGSRIGSSPAVVTPNTEWAAQGVAEIYRTRALLALGDNQPEQSQAYASKGIALLQAVGADPGGVRWRIVRVAGLGAAAGQNLNRASSELGGSARGLSDALPQSQPAAKTYFESGTVRLQRGNPSAALSEFRSGAQMLRARRNTVPSETVFPYLDALASGSRSLSGPRAAEMFDATQLIGSGVTAAFVAQAALRMGSAHPSVKALQDQEQALAELYQRRDIATNAGADASVVQDIDRQVADATKARDAAEQAVRRDFPNYFQLLHGQPTAADLLARLGAGDAFLQIVLGEKGGYGVLARDGAVTAYPINLSLAQAAQTVQALRRAFMPDARGELPPYDVALAYDLYQKLLGPVAARLAGARELIVATDGALQSLPFALLVTQAPPPITGPADYKQVAWLVKSMTLSYVPAAQSLVLLRGVAARSRAPNAYVGYGGFTPISTAAAAQALQVARDGATPVPAACGTDARELATLPPLALAASEVALTADKLGAGRAGAHIGPAFSRSSVQRGGLDRYRIVHFASHALLPTELRCLQQPVVLTGAGTGGEALLTAADIAALRLDANLVVLSACNTAGPDGRSAGEAFSGLARSFFTAGTRGVLASHWNVADESTTLMMINLLTDTAKGTRAPVSLRNVQVGMIDGAGVGTDPVRWAHPFYWAPFVYAGG
ncbi:CHAT domain-containing tetratricopeptide repeat protein [Vineibacter terrae]|uniref:CHAT domain-containing tetratricopeptide repeat protein n=1 Tax=Vineibacter terrae TaxID=2586908 RepID=UPI002E3153C5|nr:CHAT domain-containing tetratricopeptide repeat protein [Vineibacter terrae]HEX2887686.1 CHAT domain-containing tetratricopeptide repeat protein [Vineibacter terrae]